MHQNAFVGRALPGPAAGVYSAHPGPLAASKGRGWEEGKGRRTAERAGGEKVGINGRREIWKGRSRDCPPPHFMKRGFAFIVKYGNIQILFHHII